MLVYTAKQLGFCRILSSQAVWERQLHNPLKSDRYPVESDRIRRTYTVSSNPGQSSTDPNRRAKAEAERTPKLEIR